MTDIRQQRDNVRDKHIRKFTLKRLKCSDLIMYDGVIFMRLRHNTGHPLSNLPKGFHDRVLRHMIDLLTGKRTALWDEQAVYGTFQTDPGTVREIGRLVAEAAEQEREFKG